MAWQQSFSSEFNRQITCEFLESRASMQACPHVRLRAAIPPSDSGDFTASYDSETRAPLFDGDTIIEHRDRVDPPLSFAYQILPACVLANVSPLR